MMRKCKQKRTLWCIVLLIFPFVLEAGELSTRSSQQHDTEFRYTEQDEVRRNQWSLTKEEWVRYKTLMQGVRGSISPSNVSPIEVLGTHARTEEERRKYAEIWARIQHEDAERVIAFMQAYAKAYTKLYPGDTQILKGMSQGHRETVAIDSDARLLVFIKSEKCPACIRVVSKLLSDTTLGESQIDIYFIDTQPSVDDDKIRQWAVDHAVDRDKLIGGKITLNHDDGNLYRITQDVAASVPLVFKLDANAITRLTL
ncbi:MAG: TIGR03759 family integrating conjugative element protein [Gammaproteobacteria bacterium]